MAEIMKVRSSTRLMCLGMCVSILAVAAQSQAATVVEFETFAGAAEVGIPAFPDIAARSGGSDSTKRGGR